MGWKVLASVFLPIAPFALGFIIGIIPGLLLGLPGWHKAGAVIAPIIWAVGYVNQRAKNFRDVSWITFSIALFGGAGLGISIWLFGDITS